jgi:DNA-binding response OmpR family regulator
VAAVLVVDDDVKLTDSLRRALTEAGMAAVVCGSHREAMTLLEASTFDLILLDRDLPDGDGIDLCRGLRASGNMTPILVLTARNTVADRVRGLNAGADDYLAKPFDLAELLARLDALRRRSVQSSVLKLGPLEIDRMGHRVHVSDAPIDLTGIEYRLLGLLASHAGLVVDRDALLDAGWAPDDRPVVGVVEVHISRLREKLGKHAWLIETVRGAGYRLRWEQPAAKSA